MLEPFPHTHFCLICSNYSIHEGGFPHTDFPPNRMACSRTVVTHAESSVGLSSIDELISPLVSRGSVSNIH